MADGSIVFSTALDNSDLEKGIKQAEEDIEELKRKISEKTEERNALVEQLVEVKQEIIQAEKEQRDLNELLDKGVDIAARYNVAQAELEGYNAELKQAEANQKRLAAEYARTYQASGNVFKSSIAGVEARFNAFTSKVTKRMKKLFVFSFIFGALSAFKSYLMGIIQEDERFSASVQNLVATLRGFAAPLIAALIPPLTAIVNVLTAMITTLARLVDMVFHTDFVASINQARQAAQSSAAAANATNDQAKATDKLAKAQKKAAKWLAAFDELNVAQKEDSEDVTDSINAGVDDMAGGDAGASWAGMDLGKIDETLAEIMVILGAALLAVGAILAFSGINIPLGITLMAIGALMIYTAVAEQWDKLPQEIQNTIITILELIGAALIVIGVLLCFTGDIPLGIGFIIAGAAIFATAVALDWENLSNNIGGALNALGLIVGAMIAVIGVVLCFTGHIPLGIAAIIAGIAIFGISAANTPEGELPDRVQQLLDFLKEHIGIYIAVIGVMLCMFGFLPIGIGAIVAGIAIFGIQYASQNEETMNQVRGFVNSIFDFIKENVAYILAIGLILCAVGLWPLGIAAIAVGIWALVSPQTLDFDWILNTLKGIWDSVVQWFRDVVAPIFTIEWWSEKFETITKSLGDMFDGALTTIGNALKSIWDTVTGWFHDNVEPVFTVEFWGDLFKNIINGLIGMLNSGLGAFGNFASGIADGISGVLDFFGISGGWFSISMPSIPYLAQGAVIPPNRQFMAVLGDQSNGTNLEAPENLIRQIVREESGMGNGEIVALLSQMLTALQARQTLECDGYTLAKVVSKQNRINQKAYGF